MSSRFTLNVYVVLDCFWCLCRFRGFVSCNLVVCCFVLYHVHFCCIYFVCRFMLISSQTTNNELYTIKYHTRHKPTSNGKEQQRTTHSGVKQLNKKRFYKNNGNLYNTTWTTLWTTCSVKKQTFHNTQQHNRIKSAKMTSMDVKPPYNVSNIKHTLRTTRNTIVKHQNKHQ